MIALRDLVARRSAPTFDRPVIAFRAWKVGAHDTLRAITDHDHWGPGDHVARCTRPLRPNERPHAVPAKRCSCGNHAVTSIALAHRAVSVTLRWQRAFYAIVVAGLLAASSVLAAQPSWLYRAQAGALALIAIGTALGYARNQRSIVYGAVLAWGDQMAFDPVRGGVQVRSPFMRPIALVSGPQADRVAARLGLPTATEAALPALARELTDGVMIDPARFARRGPIDWLGWGLWMIALGVLRLGCMAAYVIACSIVFMVALAERRTKEV